MKTCPKCNIEHNRPGTFCSRVCANSRKWSEEDKHKKRISVLKHYGKQYTAKEVETRKIFSNEMVFVENSTYSRHRLKARIIKNNLLEHKCQECGLGHYYNFKPIVLQIDHINGVNNDNRLENLTLLCPNCHAQTTTYRGKNKKKQS